ncbi:hypothetical protein CAEBREN_22979 [Caenorhabditis brenneri]|uniref:Uncharacterized protein n=1 Tax=Caenorhabditis brenneri TaxID=135651 RepID=G0N6L7_CAEBE|nr:hypothetical protein CAEBREN_22979 [Caenorhabditis brenneri]
MRIFIALYMLVKILIAVEYEPVDQPIPPTSDSPSFQPEPDYEVDLVPNNDEPPEKTWTKRVLKDPKRVTKSPLSPQGKGLVFDIEKEMEKLKKECYPAEERIEFWDNDFIKMVAERNTVNYAMWLIGLLELRSVLGFEPYRSWENKHKRIENDDEIADAKTMMEYYELVEPELPFTSGTPFEHVLQMTEFVDKRWPSFRKIYKKYLEEKLAEFKGGNIIDRITVDYMIEQYEEIHHELVMGVLKDPIRISHSTSKNGISFDVKKEIEKIETFCFPINDRLALWKNEAELFHEQLTVFHSMGLIGILELRSVLGFESYRPWKTTDSFTSTDDNVIADAKTMKEYYELVEPNHFMLSEIPFDRVLEMTAFVDKQWPNYRNIYKKYLGEKLAEFKGGNIIDRITVDYMIEKYKEISYDMHTPAFLMVTTKVC